MRAMMEDDDTGEEEGSSAGQEILEAFKLFRA